MTITLPIPEDVDLSDMKFMPAYDRQLTSSHSWLRAKNWRDGQIAGPGLGFAMFNLWAAAFRARPAGRIDNDDDVLAEAARCDITYWREIKEAALSGWSLIAGAWYHPVVAEIVFAIWMERLAARHENAKRTWSAAAKRKADAGVCVPDPPADDLMTWTRDNFPDTAAYLDANSGGGASWAWTKDGQRRTCKAPVAAGVGPRKTRPRRPAELSTGKTDGDAGGNVSCDDGDVATSTTPCNGYSGTSTTPYNGYNGENNGYIPTSTTPCASDSRPKLSISNNTPLEGPPRPDAAARPPNALSGKAGRDWFAAEHGRLHAALGPLAGPLQSQLQRRGTSPRFTFVNALRGGWFDPRGPAIVLKTAKAAANLRASLGVELKDLFPELPGLVIRHASVDELRQRKGVSAP